MIFLSLLLALSLALAVYAEARRLGLPVYEGIAAFLEAEAAMRKQRAAEMDAEPF